MERIIREQFMMYPTDSKLINSGEHGFLRNQACNAFMTDCLKAIAMAPNIRGSVTMVRF